MNPSEGSRWFKMGRRESKPPPFHQMLSFSASEQQPPPPLVDGGVGSSQSLLLSCSEHLWDAQQDPGYGILAGTKGLFTPLQWAELHRQAVIFKCIDAKVPIPSSLLNPLGDALRTNVCPGYSVGYSSPVTYGWESFQLGSSNSKENEPERCRRTDGKKWRCANIAVPNHRYCDKHMNRGRSRSRKPVEGQNGRTKLSCAPPPAISGALGTGPKESSTIPLEQTLNRQSATGTAAAWLERRMKDGASDARDWLMNSTSIQILPSRVIGQDDPFEVSYYPREFALSSSTHLDAERKSDLEDMRQSTAFASAQEVISTDVHEDALLNLIHEEPMADQTQFSISTITSDLSSSSSSPIHEKENSALLQEFDRTRMGGGLENHMELARMPISALSGGPLGEVIDKSLNESSNGSSLNLLTDCWDSDSFAHFVSNFTSLDDLWPPS